MLKGSSDSGHPCLAPDCKRNASNDSPIRIVRLTSISNTLIDLFFIQGLPCVIITSNFLGTFTFIAPFISDSSSSVELILEIQHAVLLN